MTLLEGTVFLLLLLLSLPGLCRRTRRPGLLYPSYIVAGMIAGAFMSPQVVESWREIGELGFILLLFSVGLEVELPERRDSWVALQRAITWMAPQALLVTGGLAVAGLPLAQSAAAGVALASTSVGMAYVLWTHFEFPTEAGRKAFLEWMVAIEVLTIVALASMGPIIEGMAWWLSLLHFVGILVAAGIAAFIAIRLVPPLVNALKRGITIDTPLLVLALFAICALGNRLGLSAPKTAFVLGLFISRSTGAEVALNHKLEPLRDRMFVPVFYFGLGMLLRFEYLATWPFYAAIVAGVVLYGMRRMVFGWFFARRFGTGPSAHGITSPMLTMGAVAVDILARSHASPQLVAWTLAASLSLSLCGAFRRGSDGGRITDYEPTTVAPEAVETLDRPDPD
ncbi:Na(+)/H(+)-K(+) antiporter GerN [mine drainage metagenome]|uniref:Na(+)/H(+)-K(+) antiporter GerN n=1 Tax=mine drainage metagenome TaxID=410659 RepID=A0A1J5TCI3_9ZZZZ